MTPPLSINIFPSLSWFWFWSVGYFHDGSDHKLQPDGFFFFALFKSLLGLGKDTPHLCDQLISRGAVCGCQEEAQLKQKALSHFCMLL